MMAPEEFQKFIEDLMRLREKIAIAKAKSEALAEQLISVLAKEVEAECQAFFEKFKTPGK